MAPPLTITRTFLKIMAYLSFGLMSWLFGDDQLSVQATTPDRALALNAPGGEKTYGIVNVVPKGIAQNKNLDVSLLFNVLYETAPTGGISGRPAPVLDRNVAEASGKRVHDPVAVFIPPFPGAPEGRLMMADMVGTKYVFDVAEVRDVWGVIVDDMMAGLTTQQEARLNTIIEDRSEASDEQDAPDTGQDSAQTPEQSSDQGGSQNGSPNTGNAAQAPEIISEADDEAASDSQNPADAPPVVPIFGDVLSEAQSGDAGAAAAMPGQSGQARALDAAQTVWSGRVTTLRLDDDVTSVRVLEGPQYGNLTVNPDLSLALVLTGTTKTTPISFKLEVAYADGSTETITQNLKVEAGPQAGGWGLGDHYMLQTDSDGDLMVEHGANHRKVFVSAGQDALSLADIARMEGVKVGALNGQFFKANTQYGAAPNMAVDEEVGRLIWNGLTRFGDGPSSDWLLFERGYTYSQFAGLVPNGTVGESALHPIYVGAWGSGSDPLMTNTLSLIKGGGTNVVIDGLDFVDEIRILSGKNILLNDLTVTERGMNIQNIKGFTLRNSEVSDVTDESPRTKDFWAEHADRESGIFVKNVNGLLIENSLFDHNGWEDDYRFNLSTKGGQPPSIYSHNVYIQGDVHDVTFRDNIVMRAAADGAQLRSGGFVEDNIFIDNNNALLVSRGRGQEGEYSLVNGNVITSGAHKETEQYRGGLTQGITAQGMMSSFIDNIVTHMVDPDDPAQKAATRVSQYGIWHRYDQPIYDDTIIYNWVGDETHQSAKDNNDRFTEGLNAAVLDETTIQNFAASLLGKNKGTIPDLAAYLSDLVNAGGTAMQEAADAIAAYFRPSFEVATGARNGADTLRFVPNDLGDGMRWDNRLNWTSETLPGARPGDSVDLAGNWVTYGGTTTIKHLDFGSNGQLTLNHGRLDVTGETIVGTGGAEIFLNNAGQLWMAGYTGTNPLGITVTGGRFANTDLFSGRTDFAASGDAQVLLATDGAGFALSAGSRLTIAGNDVQIGFDGAGNAPAGLSIDSGTELRFIADKGGFSTIAEVYSGAFGTAGVNSGIFIDGGTLHLDVSALGPGQALSGTLLAADEIQGQFDDLAVTGLRNTQDLTVMVDYDLDQILFLLSPGGSGTGQIVLGSRGAEAEANSAFTQDMIDLLQAPPEPMLFDL